MAKRKQEPSIYNHYVIALVALAGLMYVWFSTLGIGPTGFASSQVGNLSAGIQTYISCTWSNNALAVSFGSSLNPGDPDINATQNYGGPGSGSLYNVTVDTLSNVAANVTIKGADLVSGSNIIGVGNVTWVSNTTAANGTNMVPGSGILLTTSFNTATQVASSEAVGSSVWYRFWLDIPSAQVAGTYVGNYTQQCQQAS